MTTQKQKFARFHLSGGAILLLLVAVALLAAHLPLLAQHAVQIWLRPHYRFFPLLMVGAGALAWLRLRGQPASPPGRPWLAGLALTAAWLALATALVLTSSWLGAVAALATMAAATYAVGGVTLCGRLAPSWVLLWLAVPPPLELDRDLILWLQSETTRWSSAVLDLLGVFHLTAGHVIEIDGRRLFVDQACSGVNSLFSVLACTLFLIFLAGRPLLRAALLLAAALVWVLLANVARVAGVALILFRWDVDLSTGWRHDAFGLMLFACAVGLIASTDQLLGFLLAPTTRTEEGGSSSDPATPVPLRGNFPWVVTLAAPAYLLLLVGHLLSYGPSESEAEVASSAASILDQLEIDLLPERMGSWQRQDFQVQARDAGNFFGEHSRTWIYRHGDRTALFSLDYPFPSWHDLTRCYTGQGWRLDEQCLHEAQEVPGGFLAARLSKPAYRHGYLLFCEFNGKGQPLQARPGAARLSLFRHKIATRSLWERLTRKPGEKAVDPAGPVFQWQLIVESSAVPTAAEESALREMFARAFARLRKRAEQSGGEPQASSHSRWWRTRWMARFNFFRRASGRIPQVREMAAQSRPRDRSSRSLRSSSVNRRRISSRSSWPAATLLGVGSAPSRWDICSGGRLLALRRRSRRSAKYRRASSWTRLRAIRTSRARSCSFESIVKPVEAARLKKLPKTDWEMSRGSMTRLR
jgi:exosortase